MKKSYLLIIACILFAHTQRAQTVVPIVQKIIQLGIIDEKQRNDVAELLKKKNDTSNAAMLSVFQYAETIKIVGKEYIKFTPASINVEKKREPAEQEKINKELLDCLDKLKSGDFINKILFDYFKNKVLSDTYTCKLQLLTELSTEYARYKWFSAELLIPFTNKLYANKIITRKSLTRLQSDIRRKKTYLPNQLVSYFQYGKSIDLSKYPNDPVKYILLLHKEVSTVYPGLRFTKFKYKIQLDSVRSSAEFPVYKVMVEMVCNGKKYKQDSRMNSTKLTKDQNPGKINIQEFYEIFNKVLSDLRSTVRLHLIQSNLMLSSMLQNNSFGIVALSRDQTEMFRQKDLPVTLSIEEFKNTIGSSRINQVVAGYKKIGILNHLTSQQIKLSTLRVNQNRVKEMNDVPAYFSSVIYSFDAKLRNTQDPYAEILKQFSVISHKAFNPTDISDGFVSAVKGRALVEFTLNGKKYSKKIIVDKDWIDLTFLDFIDDVVKENKLKGRFYELMDEGQIINYIFLKPEQYNYLKAKKLLVFEDDWELE